MRSLLCLIFLLLTPLAVIAEVICSQAAYGTPFLGDCLQALVGTGFSDQTPRYFVEPQLFTSPPDADWAAFHDPRSPVFRTQSVQLPKFWTYGKVPYSFDGAILSSKPFRNL